ncbi:hypothetical protein [Litorimonas sp. WD9-15]|uniref:hypothetical protein n=1 Tax=Litorimonas sp. WD9-15 TaxID=3418716 RepID=UPI003D056C68
MLVWIFIGIIIVAIVRFVQDRDHDKRLKYAREIAESFDLSTLFDEDYHGHFSFGDKMPEEDAYKRVSQALDAGAEKRLAYNFQEALPKWMLESTVNDFRQGLNNPTSSHMMNVNNITMRFVKARTARILELLNGEGVPISSTNSSQRRRRRRR